MREFSSVSDETKNRPECSESISRQRKSVLEVLFVFGCLKVNKTQMNKWLQSKTFQRMRHSRRKIMNGRWQSHEASLVFIVLNIRLKTEADS